MTERKAEVGGADSINQQLDESTITFASALSASEYDSSVVTNAFASVEGAVNQASEAGLRTPLNVFGALKELSDAVVETAEIHGDERTQKIFAARSRSYAAMISVLEQPSEPAPPVPRSTPPATSKRRGKRSDTRTQQTSGAKR